jgi:hypothetical protein
VAPRLVLLAVLALGCKMEAQDFQRAPSLVPIDLDGPTPPPAAAPNGEKLYQLLYAGEAGPVTAAQGQHARMMAWLAVMDFSDVQLDQLTGLMDQLDRARQKQAGLREKQDQLEQATLAPIYQQISAAYAAGGAPTEEELAGWAADLEAARTELYADADPRAQELERVSMLMSWLDSWLQSLTEAQRHDLAQCRFFLRRRLGPLLNPGDYGDLTGISWDGGDFRGVNTTFRDDDEHHMDIGGLWSTEFMRAPPNLYLDRLQLKALVLMALNEDGLREAIMARRRTPAAEPEHDIVEDEVRSPTPPAAGP